MIEGCLRNDRNAQYVLYQTYAPSMLGVCQRYTRTQAEAEDVMIEGFLKVFQNLATCQSEQALPQWIRAVMVNTAISHFRANPHLKMETALDDPMFDNYPGSTSDGIIDKVEVRQIMGLLQEMPDDFRVIFNLRAIEEYSFNDIAEALERNPNTVRIYYQRARAWLLKQIQNV